MRVAILGAGGMLGRDVCALLETSGFTVHAIPFEQVDITRREQLREALSGVEAIVNCAAYTQVDKAEEEVDAAYAVNATAVGTLGELAAANGQYVVHISTDFVYDGRKDAPYTEHDATNPLSVYGASKLAGEALLRQSGCAHCILRVEWTYGRHGTHFITKMLDRAKTHSELKVVNDQIGAPTPTTEIASVIKRALAMRLEGTYLYAAAGYASRFEVACWAFSVLGQQVAVRPCATHDFPMAAARPLNSRFDCSLIERLLGMPRVPWQDSLNAYLERWH